MNYSKKLIIRLQKYWKNRFGIDLSQEKSEEYLESLVSFYLALVDD